MTRPRLSANELAKALNEASLPIYVLDDELTVLFLNGACREWLGHAGNELQGTRCAYHCSPDTTGLEAVAAGLCPPPEAMEGQEVWANVSCKTGDGRVKFRRSRFVPLGGEPDDLVAVVALLEPHDQPQPGQPCPATSLDASPTELHEVVRRFRDEVAGRYRADRLIGDSPAIGQARRQIELAAASRASVQIVGPPGSGRQHVASAIHYGSQQKAAGSLVPLACSVLGADLIRSTVAALARGNPLGDDTPGSTLLLGDADQLPEEVQSELTAVLSGRTFPLRLIATAEQPLGELVRHGKYRPDLAALLSTITIELPPLTERREDLPALAQLFLEENNAQGIKQLAGFTPEALDLLDAYPWPGNVDELCQVVDQSYRQAEGPMVGPDDLPEQIHLSHKAKAHPRRGEETIVLDEFLGRIERELIRRALAQAKGNKAQAARLLGLTRPRLYRRLVQLGMEP